MELNELLSLTDNVVSLAILIYAWRVERTRSEALLKFILSRYPISDQTDGLG